MSSEKFSIIKFLDFSPLAFTKVVGLMLKAVVLILIVFGVIWVKNIMFPKASTVKDINVHEGGKVIINEQKRRLEYFIGGFGSMDRDGDSRIGAFGGFKW